jgi:hypothetical protein
MGNESSQPAPLAQITPWTYDFPWDLVSRGADVGIGSESLLVALRANVGSLLRPNKQTNKQAHKHARAIVKLTDWQGWVMPRLLWPVTSISAWVSSLVLCLCAFSLSAKRPTAKVCFFVVFFFFLAGSAKVVYAFDSVNIGMGTVNDLHCHAGTRVNTGLGLEAFLFFQNAFKN